MLQHCKVSEGQSSERYNNLYMSWRYILLFRKKTSSLYAVIKFINSTDAHSFKSTLKYGGPLTIWLRSDQIFENQNRFFIPLLTKAYNNYTLQDSFYSLFYYLEPILLPILLPIKAYINCPRPIQLPTAYPTAHGLSNCPRPI
jgi:hypothetical protein